MVQLLATHIGAAGITLLYLLRDTHQDWEDTKVIISLQYRRTVNKMNSGN